MTSDRVIPEVVDEIAFQTRRNLAQRALADIILFSQGDQAAIQKGARYLLEGKVLNLHPRHLVSAAGYALATGKIPPRQLAKLVIDHLNQLTARSVPTLTEAQAALAS